MILAQAGAPIAESSRLMTNRIAILKRHTATETTNALALAGKRGEALKLLDQVNNPPWKAFSAALVYAGLGEKDEAFRGLERVIEVYAPTVGLVKVDPRFDRLWQDTRFRDLPRRMKLPE